MSQNSSAVLVIYEGDGLSSVNIDASQLEAVYQVLGLKMNSPLALPFDISEDYSPELEAQDPYFTREEQKELRRRIKAVKAGRFVEESVNA